MPDKTHSTLNDDDKVMEIQSLDEGSVGGKQNLDSKDSTMGVDMENAVRKFQSVWSQGVIFLCIFKRYELPFFVINLNLVKNPFKSSDT